MFNLEQQEIYSRYKNPENAGRLDHADFSLDGSNPFCGDTVHLELILGKRGEIIHLVHTCQACAICTAAADILPELTIGKTLLEIKAIPSAAMTERLGIPLSPPRVKCAVLALETLKQAQV
jgi:nitrogen fixation NifU-like protein